MDNPVYKYFVKQQGQVNENIELYLNNKEDVEAIHNLRLGLKRIKVLLYQLEYLSEQKYIAKDSLKYINGLFKKAGNIRDVQVQQKVIKEYCKELGIEFDVYLHYLLNLENKYRPLYEKALNDFDRSFFDNLDKQMHEILKDIPEDVIHYKAAILLNDKLRSIRSIYYKTNKEKRFHKIRRHLKDINYLNNIMEGKLPVANAMHINEDRLKELGALLGDWHDKVNALIFLDTYKKSLGRLDISQEDPYKKLHKHISNIKRTEYRELNKAFKQELRI